jgi:hypothetical protein
MADNALVEVIPKEAAKELVKETAKLTREMGGFLSKVFGTLPQDTVGVLGGDWLHHVRVRNAHRLQQRTEEILKECTSTKPLGPNEAIPLLNAAQDESRPELQELWARLLANAMDGARPPINRRFINVLRSLDILEARIIQRLDNEGAIDKDVEFLNENLAIDWTEDLSVTPDQLVIAFNHLFEIDVANISINGMISGFSTGYRNLTITLDEYYRVSRLLVDKRAKGETDIYEYHIAENFAFDKFKYEFKGTDKIYINYYDVKEIEEYIKDCTGTISMKTLGRELLRALSLTNEPVREAKRTAPNRRTRPRTREKSAV